MRQDKGVNPTYLGRARDLHELAGLLAVEGWDRMRALRLAHDLQNLAIEAAVAESHQVGHDAREALVHLERILSIKPAPEPAAIQQFLGRIEALTAYILSDQATQQEDWGGLLAPAVRMPSGYRLLGLGDDAGVLLRRRHAQDLSIERMFDSVATLAAELASNAKSVVLLDAGWLSNHDSELAGIAKLADVGGTVFVAVTEGKGFTNQLAIMRSGVQVFAEWPLTPERLLETLDGVAWPPQEPYRVMLVDDDQSMLAFAGTVLRAAGMEVTEISDPVIAMEFVEEFSPDVMVLDIVMPACRGTELATLIRQKDSFAHIPVIYLTAMSDEDNRKAARMTAGEDYLLKPIDPEALASAVGARARRARHLLALERRGRNTWRLFDRLRYAMDQHALVSATDPSGAITYANNKFCEVSGYDRAEFIGRNHRLVKSDRHTPEFYDQMWHTLSNGRIWQGEMENRRKDGRAYWVQSTIVPFLDEEGTPESYVAIRTEITKAKIQSQLLGMVREGMGAYVSTLDLSASAGFLLQGLLDLSQGEYGFIGEVLYDEGGKPYLKTHAISDIAWNDETRRLYDENSKTGLEFRNLKTLFGAALETGDPVISNDPPNDSRSGGLPQGHPPLRSFMGVPIYYGDEMVGMYGLANRPGGYDKNLIELLAPFNATYAAMIEADRSAARQSRMLDDLLHAKDRAEAASAAKSGFLASMSHELRTPLNAILGFSELMLDGAVAKDEGETEGAREIHQAGKHLLNIINDLLDLARIESGKMEMKIGAVLATKVLDECRPIARGLAEQYDVSLEYDIAVEEDQRVEADALRLKQALLNLISNAFKYNKPGGSVVVSCRMAQNGNVHFAVRDTGIGVPPERLGRLFEPFDRLGAEGGNIQGTGIGLAISRQLVEMMGGRIGVESTPGEGSEFWVEIHPVRHEVAHAAPAAVAAGNVVRRAHKADGGGEIDYTVLYVEDNNLNQRLMQGILALRSDVKLVQADSAEVGLDIADAILPDLIFMDINLPGMNGYQALEKIKINPRLRGIPIVAVTANAMQGDEQQGLEAGFRAYLTKPFSVEAIHGLLSTLLTKKEA